MKTWRKPLQLITGIVVFVLAGGVWFIHSALAATGSIYLSPATSSVQNGNTITLSLRINPGTSVDGVQATVNFDTSKLQYISYSTAGSAFAAQLQQSQSGGTVTIARGDFSGGISSDSLVETVTFKAVAGNGATGVTLTAANATSGGNYTNPGVANATVSLTNAPVATCPTGQTGTPPNCVTPTPPPSGGGNAGGGSSGGTAKTGTGGSTGGSGSTGAPSGSSTPVSTAPTTVSDRTPVLGDKDVQFTRAVFNTTTKAATQVYIKYGLDRNNLNLNTDISPFATSHTLTLDQNMLIPGTTYYYVIVSKDGAGNVSETAVNTVHMQGLQLKVGVFDKNHKPIRGKTVVLHSTPYTVKTDKQGYATISDVAPGTHHLTYNSGNQQFSQELQVVNNVQTTDGKQVAPLQNVSVVYSLEQSSSSLWVRAIVGLVLAALLIIGAYIFIKRERQLVAEPLLTGHAVVIGGSEPKEPLSDSVPTSPQTIEPISATPRAEATEQKLTSIPYPNSPAPGATVQPHEEDEKDF